MLKHNLGYPRVGLNRELKNYIEKYWENKISEQELFSIYKEICKINWMAQCHLDLIPCNDFSISDHILDMSFLLGVIPARYMSLLNKITDIDLYFAMAIGYKKNDIISMEMTKLFNTNYHYIVPEFVKAQKFYLKHTIIFDEFNYAKQIIINKQPKVVIIGPISYLLLGKEKQNGFNKIDLIEKLIPIYVEILNRLKQLGALWIQLDEPFITLNLSEKEKEAFRYTYKIIPSKCKNLKLLIATYFESLVENLFLATQLTISALHIDLIEAPNQLDKILNIIQEKLILSLGIIDGRNIWKNNYENSFLKIKKAVKILGEYRVLLAPNSSLLHVPIDLNIENDITQNLKNIMSFANQKLKEIDDLNKNFNDFLLLNKIKKYKSFNNFSFYKEQRKYIYINNEFIQKKSFKYRKKIQKYFKMTGVPTTTIGSFPQTEKIRNIRKKFKTVKLSSHDYEYEIKKSIIAAIHKQEEIGLDILVHGEFERNDMVEYFGEFLEGFLITKNGWVQSYGSRCVKPPIIYDDIIRTKDITVKWSLFAQKNTTNPVKGMITGPITLFQWSFFLNDKPIYKTIQQISFAIKQEVLAIESSGINIIQIDEPAIKESMPLKIKKWNCYLYLVIKYFLMVSSLVKNTTQIQTHMCYSEFHDILNYISVMDVDVITIETYKSKMDLLNYFSKYTKELGPGLYDVHSKIIPSINEIYNLLKKASFFIPITHLWVNPDCGLKTRKWKETILSLQKLVLSAKKMRLVNKM